VKPHSGGGGDATGEPARHWQPVAGRCPLPLLPALYTRAAVELAISILCTAGLRGVPPLVGQAHASAAADVRGVSAGKIDVRPLRGATDRRSFSTADKCTRTARSQPLWASKSTAGVCSLPRISVTVAVPLYIFVISFILWHVGNRLYPYIT